MRDRITEDRKLVLEIVVRMREAESLARRSYGLAQKLWKCRANTLNEVYTEVRGSLLGPRP